MFTREDTKALKGIAIILMLFHHLATWPSRYPVGFPGFPKTWYNLGTLMVPLADHARICVTIFFFLGGYGIYKRWASGKFSLFDSILSLYRRYWKVFVIFAPLCYLVFSRSGEGINPLAAKYNITNVLPFLQSIMTDFLALTNRINSEWWFLAPYLCLIPLGYLFCFIPRDSNATRGFVKELGLVILADIVLRQILPQFANIELLKPLGSNFYYNHFIKLDVRATCFFEGIIFAKYDAMAKLKKRVEQTPMKIPLCIAGTVFFYFAKVWVIDTTADLIVIPIMLAFLSVLCDHLRHAKRVLIYLGHHSTNMWFVHSFYCYYFLEVTKIVYATQIMIVDVLILLALSLATSIVLELFYKYLGKAWHKVFPTPAAGGVSP